MNIKESLLVEKFAKTFNRIKRNDDKPLNEMFTLPAPSEELIRNELGTGILKSAKEAGMEITDEELNYAINIALKYYQESVTTKALNTHISNLADMGRGFIQSKRKSNEGIT